MGSLLISFVGDTDPFRGSHEGSLLHIVKQYKPQNCIVIFSQSMKDKELKDQAIRKSLEFYLKRLHPEKTMKYTEVIAPETLEVDNFSAEGCRIQFLFTDELEVQIFDRINNLSEKIFALLLARNFPEKVLLNVSSGTPQMKQSLSILGVYYKSLLDTYIVQVDSPARKSNSETPHDKTFSEADLETYFELEDAASNRCSEPDLFYVQRIFAKRKLQSLIERYDYVGAEKVIEENKYLPDFIDEKTKALIKHWSLRSQYKYQEADRCINDPETLKNLRPVQTSDTRQLFEFFLTMQINANNQSWSTYILQISPYATNLLLYYLEKKYPQQMNKILINDKSRGKQINAKYLRKNETELEKKMYPDNQFSNKTTMDISLRILLIVFEYYKGKETEPAVLNIYNKMNIARDIETNIRNVVAHQMFTLEDSVVKEKTGKSLKEIHKFIIELSSRVISSVPTVIWADFLKNCNEELLQQIT